MVKVTYGTSNTVNMGNFESVKVNVEVTFDCSEEELEETYAKARSFVDSHMQEELDSIGGPQNK